MKAHVKAFFFIFFIFIIGSKLSAKEMDFPDYEIYVDQIVTDFSKDMKKKYNLHFYGSGGKMPVDIEEINVLFISCQRLTVEETRKIVVNSTQSLLQRINNHEKIRPFLREYPFKANRIEISISFRTETDDYPLDGAVARVHLGKNKIVYKSAEIQMIEPTPLIYMNEKNEVVKEMRGGGPEEVLIPLMEETYQDALKIVGILPGLDRNN